MANGFGNHGRMYPDDERCIEVDKSWITARRSALRCVAPKRTLRSCGRKEHQWTGFFPFRTMVTVHQKHRKYIRAGNLVIKAQCAQNTNPKSKYPCFVSPLCMFRFPVGDMYVKNICANYINVNIVVRNADTDPSLSAHTIPTFTTTKQCTMKHAAR
jgi:hypothetical protein